MIVLICDIALTVATIIVNKTGDVAPPTGGQVETSAAIGWLSVFGSVFCFGCYGILIKTPAVQEANTDCMVFQCYYSSAVAFVSFVIWCAAGSSAGLAFSGSSFAYGLLFAVLWISSQVFAYKGIQILGYAVGPAIWIGVSICMSFMWGVVAFGEEVNSAVGAFAAIAVLLIGVALAATSSKISDLDQKKARDMLVQEKPDGAETKDAPAGNAVFGFMCALGVGLTNGSTMVPLSCFQKGCFGIEKFNADAYDGEIAALAFLPSLALGILVVQPIMFALYWGPSIAKGVRPQFHFKAVALPAFLTGLYWGMGNFNAMFATVYLGQTIGFPLTQCCLVINGMWGILYYKEIQGARAIGLFVLASFVIVAGAAFDGLWG